MKKKTSKNNVDTLAVNTIKTLAMDAVQKANSGHPGMPMGAADYAYILWSRYLRHNPADPQWPDRDRFILSAGHGSMLLYSLLHLSGYDVSLDDLKQFRQWGSRTPGHPEYGCLPGVETTTGPLGQGFATGVGMALASKMSAARFNKKKHRIVGNRIFGIVSDGDLMEGISTEAASLAGHLRLDNIIYIYDDNKITIDGGTELSFSEDIWDKFKAMGWHVIWTDGHDHESIKQALDEAVAETERPKLIIAATHIANGSPGKQDSASSHGAPLGEDEVAATKENIGWKYKKDFFVPAPVYKLFEDRRAQLEKEYNAWKRTLRAWEKANPGLAKRRKKMLEKDLPKNLEKKLLDAIPDEAKATRVLSGKALQAAAKVAPGLAGGSADLAPSNKTMIDGEKVISAADFTGRNMHFGIREHAMAAALNGLALYGGFIPYGGTFLIFSDYMRASIRLAALMRRQVVYVFTHDSFYVGEDGPTHQPIEQLSSLRAIPGLHVMRPADRVETAFAWAAALRRSDGPTALSLTRQGVPLLEREKALKPSEFNKGGYVISHEAGRAPEIVVLAAGSEVGLAMEAKKQLGRAGGEIRVVSMPCHEQFDAQSERYRNSVIPPDCDNIVAVEAGSPQCWYKYAGRNGLMLCIDHFGESAPGKVIAEKFGFTAENVASRIKEAYSL